MPSSTLSEIARANIRRLRKAKGLHQAALGALIGIEQSTVSKIERGEQLLTIDMAAQVAVALGVSLADLLSPEARSADALAEAIRLVSLGGQEGGHGLIELGLRIARQPKSDYD